MPMQVLVGDRTPVGIPSRRYSTNHHTLSLSLRCGRHHLVRERALITTSHVPRTTYDAHTCPLCARLATCPYHPHCLRATITRRNMTAGRGCLPRQLPGHRGCSSHVLTPHFDVIQYKIHGATLRLPVRCCISCEHGQLPLSGWWVGWRQATTLLLARIAYDRWFLRFPNAQFYLAPPYPTTMPPPSSQD